MTIFPGDAESRFSKWLLKKQLLLTQGIDISMIGTHSFRKGIAPFLSGTPGGPTAISIYLRAGWSFDKKLMLKICNQLKIQDIACCPSIMGIMPSCSSWATLLT